MVYVAVRTLIGIAGVPSHRTSASKWLTRNGVSTFRVPVNGGEAEAVFLSDLPEDVRRAYLLRHIDGQDLDPGTYDDAAHEAFLQACASRRERAERKAEVARFLMALGPGVNWPDRLQLVHEKFGVKGHSKPRLKALLTRLDALEASGDKEAVRAFQWLGGLLARATYTGGARLRQGPNRRFDA